MKAYKTAFLLGLVIILLSGCTFPGQSTESVTTPEETEPSLPPPLVLMN